jgi:membrane associated rhomboid family serine protease
MFPVGDDNRDRERWPVVTAVLIAINVAAFLFELSLQSRSPAALAEMIQRWAVVPREYRVGHDLPPSIGLPFWSTLFTSMFLHGGWGHLLGNMLYLWVFGDNVEDRLGRVPFVLFYLGTGIAAAAAQIVFNLDSRMPMLGASGAISGVLGAYIAMFPTKRVRVVFFIMLIEVPAIVCIGLWAVTQFVSSFGSLSARTAETGGVAYLAHAGGFLAGLVVALIWRSISGVPQRRPHVPVRHPW